ncbi:Uncharacterized protein APZ42_011646 [Daphnia magna]|uniref:Uncharacterized protein n=1 Tax=Daphnia magna TaxID=35525 RepID=A0A0P5TZK4_9CRUS|nr:Uncharacterized protein APZ42_011646 [Daphnia magna]
MHRISDLDTIHIFTVHTLDIRGLMTPMANLTTITKEQAITKTITRPHTLTQSLTEDIKCVSHNSKTDKFLSTSNLPICLFLYFCYFFLWLQIDKYMLYQTNYRSFLDVTQLF